MGCQKYILCNHSVKYMRKTKNSDLKNTVNLKLGETSSQLVKQY